MTGLKIIGVLLGLLFTVLGYLIVFKKKYHLINGFAEAQKNGTKDEAYARSVGMVEFVVGIAILLAGVALLLFA